MPPKTLTLQKVAKPDQRTASNNKTNAGKKKGQQKFSSDIFESLAKLFESFVGKSLSDTSVNMVLLLRALYKNLTPDIAKVLSNSKNVKLLTEQLEEETKDVSEFFDQGDLDIVTSIGKFISELKKAIQKLDNVLQKGAADGESSGKYLSEMDALSRFLAKQYDSSAKTRETFLKDATTQQEQEKQAVKQQEQPKEVPPVIDLTKAWDELPKGFSFNNAKVFVASPKLSRTLMDKLKISEKALQGVVGTGATIATGATTTTIKAPTAGSAAATGSAAAAIPIGATASKTGVASTGAAPVAPQQKKPALVKAVQERVNTLNEKVGTPKVGPDGKGQSVSISVEQFNKLMELAKQQEKTAAGVGGPEKGGKDDGSPAAGILNKRAKMDDGEAFQRNINEGYSALQDALGEKNVDRIGLPSKQIAAAIRAYFGATTHIIEDADDNLNTIENELVKGPKKGLIATIKSWVFKILIGGFIAVTAVSWLKKNFMSWMPKGKDGNVLHGPTLFGIKLPNLKDLGNIIRATFTMMSVQVGKLVRYVKSQVGGLMKALNIKSIAGFLNYMKNFALGYLAGKAAAAADKVLSWLEMIPAIGSAVSGIRMGIKLISMLAGATVAAVNDWLGSGRDDSGLAADAAKWGEDKLDELIGENMHGTRAGQILAKKASKIKPLVPMASVLPESMTAKDEKGNVKVKALIPNLPVVNLAKGMMADYEGDVNKVAHLRREENKKTAGQSGIKQVDSQLANTPEPPWDLKYGEPSPEKRATLKFIAVARKNISVLQQAKKKADAMPKFDGKWSSDCWWFNGGKDPNKVWNPEWQYTGANRSRLKSIVPLEPFGDATKGTMYDIAEPFEHEIMGVIPLAVRIPKTNAVYWVDSTMWERDRINVAISAWESAISYAEGGLEDSMWGGDEWGTEGFKKRMQREGADWVEISQRPYPSSRIADRRKSEMTDKWNRWNERHGKTKQKVAELRDGMQAARKKDNPQAAEPPKQEKKADEPGLVSRFWTQAKGIAGKLKGKAKEAFEKGGFAGLAQAAGKEFMSLFSEEEKKAAVQKAEEPPKPSTHGTDYIKSILNTPFWKSLSKDGVKADELRKTLSVDNWFDVPVPANDKIYQTGIGKMFYNILIKLGFKYDKVVWQNPQFLKVRPIAMQKMVDSLNEYLTLLVQPHGAYLISLLSWAKAHTTKEEQDAVLEAAKKEVTEIGQNVNRNKFWEFVAANYIPTDMHLVVRNKEGKIIKEEGKELRGLLIPKELYDQDPAYWSNVMEMMNQSAVPPQDLAELQTARALVFKLIQSTAKGLQAWAGSNKDVSAKFDLFAKNLKNDQALDAQVQELVKEMIPEDDPEGEARLQKVVKLAEERKEEAKKDRKSWTGYWRELHRKWQDRISEENLKQLKTASLKLSDNIFDYIGLVKEIPVGNNIVMDSSAQKPTPVFKLMPDVAF